MHSSPYINQMSTQAFTSPKCYILLHFDHEVQEKKVNIRQFKSEHEKINNRSPDLLMLCRCNITEVIASEGQENNYAGLVYKFSFVFLRTVLIAM